MLNGRLEIEDWEPAAQALRNELAEYGGLLQLLEEQKQAILRRNLDALADLNGQIEEQLELAQTYQKERERLLREQGRMLATDGEATLKELLPQLPESVHPLFKALLEEASNLLERVQKGTRRNRMLLARASDIQEQILRKLKPRGVTKTYTARGRVRIRSFQSGGLDLSA